MPKKIYYLVGAYGCGKTTATKIMAENLIMKIGEKVYVDYITEDDIFWFLKNPDLYTRQIFYLMSFYYKLRNKLAILEDDSILIVDGHPLLAMCYAQTFFELDDGHTLNMRQLMEIGRHQYRMMKYFSSELLGIEETIIYINLPLREHTEMIAERLKDRPNSEEEDIDYLVLLRNIIHRSVLHLGENLYNSNVIEINNLKAIKKIIT